MSEALPGGWTLEKLRAKSIEDRYTLWLNARRKATPDAQRLVDFIEASGLEFAPAGGISMTDPRALQMRDIIESPEGRKACLDATAAGLPGLAGVEPLIVAAMGARYGAFSQMTLTSGYLVAEVMRSAGYEIDGRRPMPAGSVAQTAAFWKPAKR